jgi:hypothetical protein
MAEHERPSRNEHADEPAPERERAPGDAAQPEPRDDLSVSADVHEHEPEPEPDQPDDPPAHDDEKDIVPFEERTVDSSPRLSIEISRDPFRTEIDADGVFVPPPAKVRAYAKPGAVVRRVVMGQLALVLVGALPWWLLLHLGIEASVLEVAWLGAIAVGIGLGLQGHARHQTWQSVFGWTTSAAALAFQMRGADLLLGFGIVVFDALLVAFVLLTFTLGRATLHEIDAVA